jgi:tRNA threonylcarbamoyladenosine modification (KEOPS) complex Cgi121 subunit
MEFTFMKIYSIANSNGVSNYYIGINQIEIDPKEVQIKELVELIELIQGHHEDIVLQFFNDRYILNSEHILHACYFVQKAFYTKNNISNKKNLELLLYLAAKRQIKLSLEWFGVSNYNLQDKRISFCIISLEDNLQKVNIEINSYLHSKDISLNLENLSIDKIKIVKKYFEFSDNQILTVLCSYGYKNDILDINSLNLESLYEVLNDLICEKMALLSLEKRRSF